ncbi:two-component sensor histidine kinase [Nocardioides baekrokdamisoli]|uniref:histidine kinase n=1 Tax=Nocardioides baekrokdamisoli TaxID=1804624 RepID=A0A3G9IGX8_9ACTN|nr:HAMP domain-containing sensor histidine kinase [Nocardioides baekrokdamisoli]BBH18267.1 two-component sensor histidine kinase [Nocardioides baekrokdamisoli]
MAAVSVLIGTVTAVAIHSSLVTRLDGEVRSISNLGPYEPRNRPPGALQAGFPQPGSPPTFRAAGSIFSDQRQGAPLSAAALNTLQHVPTDGRARNVEVPGVGTYRVVATIGPITLTDGSTSVGMVVGGLPLTEVNATMRNLITWELMLTAFGVVIAGAAGSVLVRRQLRPLREVAATAHTAARLPLAKGDVVEIARVPSDISESGTEVGDVGSALNTLLDHVETSLAVRHRSEQQVRQFVADASHELRTPLTTIAGYAELAQAHPEDKPAVEVAWTKVRDESARMTRLVEDLLLLARLDAGRPLQRESVDLSALLVEAVSDARVVDPDRKWTLTSESDDPVLVLGDDQRLHQVVTNLLSNATRYTPEGSNVTVRVRRDGFDVHDDGPGFPPDLASRAFERFVRGDEARNRAGGTGLGLSLVHAIVTAHGGTVTLASAPGSTTIAVRLPT